MHNASFLLRLNFEKFWYRPLKKNKCPDRRIEVKPPPPPFKGIMKDRPTNWPTDEHKGHRIVLLPTTLSSKNESGQKKKA